ncbi:MAG: 50S ribosomal protein L27 [Patescibacteria group bacterium]
MAHTKAGSTSKLGRDSESKRLGIKLSGGQVAITGNIIVRQRGSRYVAGNGVRIGSDDTLYAIKNGNVKFSTLRKRNYDGNTRTVKVVAIV